MKTITIAFDCDGTLIQTQLPGDDGDLMVNERIRSLLVTLASFKNTKIIVWSGGGEQWARYVVNHLGLEHYVDQCASKNHVGTTNQGKHLFVPEITPDIAIDDIQDCELGVFNLIVREK